MYTYIISFCDDLFGLIPAPDWGPYSRGGPAPVQEYHSEVLGSSHITRSPNDSGDWTLLKHRLLAFISRNYAEVTSSDQRKKLQLHTPSPGI